jgi:D-3-phosphoglycerate dehydrogenase / 2-oxoglutarate reductase
MKILILAPFDSSVLTRLRQTIDVTYESWMETKRLLSTKEFIERIQEQGTEIVVVEADFLPREVFEGAPKLRFVGVCRADVSHIDIAAATEHRVPVVNTPARNAIAVAELTLGLMLSMVRKIPAAHNMVSSGNWVDPAAAYFSMRGSELWGKVIGIVGFGAIGQQVAKRLQTFDATIMAYDPYVDPEDMRAVQVTPASLDEIMSRSDIVSVHCSTTKETVGLIKAQDIALMKPTAYFVNAASAYVVDQDALAQALSAKRIAGGAFDVYQTWPVKPDDPLLKLDNVVLTPHIGGATAETILRHSQMVADDIESFLRGERPKRLVNPEAW